jgi:hypothetical protein
MAIMGPKKNRRVRRAIWSSVLFGLVGMSTVTRSDAQVFATATSTNHTNGRVVIFRYVQTFGPGFTKEAQPDRVILVWKYKSAKGMPSAKEHQQMDALEDALAPLLEADAFATLALVSTGEDLREWIYYTRSQDEFLRRLNAALIGKPAFPIEIHASADPLWTTYETFKSGTVE